MKMHSFAKSTRLIIGFQTVYQRGFSQRHFAQGANQTATGRGANAESQTKRSMSDLFSLKDKTTIITGGARGIGLSLVESVAEAGSNVAILDVLDRPQHDLSQLGVKAQYYR